VRRLQDFRAHSCRLRRRQIHADPACKEAAVRGPAGFESALDAGDPRGIGRARSNDVSQASAACRICRSPEIQPVLSLGVTPLADGLRRRDQLDQPEPTFPLNVAFCPKCSLVQLVETVPPEELFCQDYPYYSSFSPALLKHSRENALDL